MFATVFAELKSAMAIKTADREEAIAAVLC